MPWRFYKNIGYQEHGIEIFRSSGTLTILLIAFGSWYAWGSALIADLLITLAGVPQSLNWLLIIVATYLFCVTAYIGYGAMDWVSRFAVPAMIILMIWSLAIAWGDVGGYAELQAIAPAGEMGVGEALTVIVSTFVSGGTQVTNWN